ncbi:membrane protein [Streptomyces sp. LaPpAH-108]|uniref:membrane protein n=1 Tax=Streptomyces sp. LaPpAH-108 TaxID=1155714 RepID=UPI000476EC61|nr:membrane protein [Streptomyces sp. LaPpAH-108]
MSDTPGWASPGSSPSPDGREPGATGPAEPTEPGAQAPDASSPGTGAKWAEGQPPPAQWSAPAGPQAPGHTPPPPPPGPGWGAPRPGGYGGYGGGYGSPGGWGGGWGGPPPVAKPGIIPLRPLGIGEILDGAVSTMRTYWRTVLGISLTVAVVSQVAVLLLRGFVLDDTASFADPTLTASELGRTLGRDVLGSLVVAAVLLLSSIFATGMLTTVTSQAVLGRPVRIGEAWSQARPRLLRLLGLLLLLTALCVGVFAVGIAPGILIGETGGSDAAMAITLFLGILGAFLVVVWLMVRYSLAPSALMLERQGVLKSMGRSTKLVNGSWWRIFGIQLLAWIITNIVSSILAIPFVVLAFALDSGSMLDPLATGDPHLSWSFLIISGIGSVIASTITIPLNAGITVLLYIDQRIRREALDLELARAAGVQDHGTGPAPVPGG